MYLPQSGNLKAEQLISFCIVKPHGEQKEKGVFNAFHHEAPATATRAKI